MEVAVNVVELFLQSSKEDAVNKACSSAIRMRDVVV